MNPLYHLVWTIPVVVAFGFGIAAYWPLGKNPAPPHVGFDAQLDQYLADKGRDPETYASCDEKYFFVFGEPRRGRTYPEGVPTPDDFGEGVK